MRPSSLGKPCFHKGIFLMELFLQRFVITSKRT